MQDKPIIIVAVPDSFYDGTSGGDPAGTDDWVFYIGTFMENVRDRTEVHMVPIGKLQRLIEYPALAKGCATIYVRSRKEALSEDDENCFPLEDDYKEPFAWMTSGGPAPVGYRVAPIKLR